METFDLKVKNINGFLTSIFGDFKNEITYEEKRKREFSYKVEFTPSYTYANSNRKVLAVYDKENILTLKDNTEKIVGKFSSYIDVIGYIESNYDVVLVNLDIDELDSKITELVDNKTLYKVAFMDCETMYTLEYDKTKKELIEKKESFHQFFMN